MKIKILIPVYNDWQSVLKLIDEINNLSFTSDFQVSIIICLNVTKRYLQKMSHFTQLLSWYRQYLLTLTYNSQGHGVIGKVIM